MRAEWSTCRCACLCFSIVPIHRFVLFPKIDRNFTRVSSGPELGAYHHQFFLRDQPHLAAQMFCKNARTMLAMQSASPAPTATTVEKPVASPTTTNVRSSNLQGLSASAEVAPNSDSSAVLPTPPHFDHNISLQLLERQMSFLREQKEQANRMLIERAMFMQQRLQHDQLMQAQTYASMGLPPPPPRQPSNNRASAA
jgi:hypothetical protein